MGLQGLCRDPVDSTGLWIIPPAPFFSSSVVWKRERDLWLLRCGSQPQVTTSSVGDGARVLNTREKWGFRDYPQPCGLNSPTGLWIIPPALFFNPYVHKRELDHSKEIKSNSNSLFVLLWVRRCADVRFLVRTSAHQHSHRKPTSLSRTGEEPGCQTLHTREETFGCIPHLCLQWCGRQVLQPQVKRQRQRQRHKRHRE